MNWAEQSSLILSVVDRRDGFEHDVVARYAQRLVQLAGRELPGRLTRRVDPEDIVQSVFRSFFQRHDDAQFSFSEANDLWRLLVTMTYHKVASTVVHHHRQKRDPNREARPATDSGVFQYRDTEPTAADLVLMMDLLDVILVRLPESAQAVVRLRLENYTTEEIAGRLGVSRRTVLRSLKRVRDVATEFLAEQMAVTEGEQP